MIKVFSDLKVNFINLDKGVVSKEQRGMQTLQGHNEMVIQKNLKVRRKINKNQRNNVITKVVSDLKVTVILNEIREL